MIFPPKQVYPSYRNKVWKSILNIHRCSQRLSVLSPYHKYFDQGSLFQVFNEFLPLCNWIKHFMQIKSWNFKMQKVLMADCKTWIFLLVNPNWRSKEGEKWVLKCKTRDSRKGPLRWLSEAETIQMNILTQWRQQQHKRCLMKVSNQQQRWSGALTELSLSIANASHPLQRNKQLKCQIRLLLNCFLCSAEFDFSIPLLTSENCIAVTFISMVVRSNGGCSFVEVDCEMERPQTGDGVYFISSISREGSSSSTAAAAGSSSCTWRLIWISH